MSKPTQKNRTEIFIVSYVVHFVIRRIYNDVLNLLCQNNVVHVLKKFTRNRCFTKKTVVRM